MEGNLSHTKRIRKPEVISGWMKKLKRGEGGVSSPTDKTEEARIVWFFSKQGGIELLTARGSKTEPSPGRSKVLLILAGRGRV